MTKTLISTTYAAVPSVTAPTTTASTCAPAFELGASWQGYRTGGFGHAAPFAAAPFVAAQPAAMRLAVTAAKRAPKPAVTRNDANPLGNPPGAQPG